MLRKVTDLTDATRLKELIAPSVFNPSVVRLDYLLTTVYAIPQRKLYVWEEDGQPAGILGIERVGRDAALLLHIAVDERFRHRGIASRMVSGVIAEEGLKALYSETDQESVGFYRAYGFQVTSLGEKHPGIERFSCRWEAETAS
ncbi:MAG: GNAT family N-acetyltransferase [Chloroflexota bacterium]|nr:GNAT family N-acetyltransferase [Chloroflexota bacterium]